MIKGGKLEFMEHACWLIDRAYFQHTRQNPRALIRGKLKSIIGTSLVRICVCMYVRVYVCIHICTDVYKYVCTVYAYLYVAQGSQA